MSSDKLRISTLSAGLVLIGALGLPLVSQAAGTSSSATVGKNSLSSSDRTFIEKAAQGGLAEVELGKLAAQKAENAQVKQFGQQMTDDHSKANAKLEQIAANKGVTLPKSMDASSRREYDKLEKLSGAAFDREYMKTMVSDHEKDVKSFQSEEKSAKDADVKNFAETTLPTLEEHLKLAKSDHAAVASTAKSASKSTKSAAPHA